MPRAVSPRAPQTLPGRYPGARGRLSHIPIVPGNDICSGSGSGGNGASPPAQECTVFPTAVQITTTWVTCSNRSLSSYIYGPKHPDQGVRTPSRSSREAPPASSSSWGSGSPWACGHIRPTSAPSSHGPPPPSSVSFSKDDACWFWGTQAPRTTSSRDQLHHASLRQGSLFQIRLHPEVPELRTGTYLWGPPLAIVTGQQPQTGGARMPEGATGPVTRPRS